MISLAPFKSVKRVFYLLDGGDFITLHTGQECLHFVWKGDLFTQSFLHSFLVGRFYGFGDIQEVYVHYHFVEAGGKSIELWGEKSDNVGGEAFVKIGLKS